MIIWKTTTGKAIDLFPRTSGDLLVSVHGLNAYLVPADFEELTQDWKLDRISSDGKRAILVPVKRGLDKSP